MPAKIGISPPRALIHGLKPFRKWLRIRRENRLYSNVSGVIDTAETISAMSLTPLNRFDTAEISNIGKYPHTMHVLEAEKSWGLDRRSMTPLKPIYGDFRSDYLGEYDAICKTGLAC
jgi:hypothetical protein